MRKIVAISALSVLAAGSVAGALFLSQTPRESMTADVERDLNLASSVQTRRTGLVSAIEQGGSLTPSGTEKGRRAPVVTQKRAPSAAPSHVVAEVAAAPPTDAAVPAPVPPSVTEPMAEAAPSPEPTTRSSAPDPTATSSPAAIGGPAAGGVGDGDRGIDTRGGGRPGDELPPSTGVPPSGPSTVIQVVSGVIMRGGSAGHDNCEPVGRRPRDGNNPAVGMIGAIGTVILNGGGAPRGTLPGGNRSGRRW